MVEGDISLASSRGHFISLRQGGDIAFARGISLGYSIGDGMRRDLDTIWNLGEELRQMPGWKNAGDAVRHATWMKRSTQKTNAFTAYLAGVGHEAQNIWNWVTTQPRNQPFSELVNDVRMDLHNNKQGIKAGMQQSATFSNLVIDPDSNEKIPY